MQNIPVRESPHIAYCGGVFGRVSLMASDTVLADHARNCMQVLVNVHARELVVRIDGNSLALSPFDALVIAPRQVYAVPPRFVASREASSAGILLIKAPSSRSRDALGSGVRQKAGPSSVVKALSSSARDDATQLVADLLHPVPKADSVERGVLALQSAVGPLSESLRSSGRGAPSQEWIEREIEVFQDLALFPSISRRAEVCGMSERHFVTLFRRATRLPPKAYYNMLRLEAAFSLLSDAYRPVLDIAYQLGFSAPPHFTRFMRLNTGWTPTGYRAHLQHLPTSLLPRLSLTD